jgi:hypothetical protein
MIIGIATAQGEIKRVINGHDMDEVAANFTPWDRAVIYVAPMRYSNAASHAQIHDWIRLEEPADDIATVFEVWTAHDNLSGSSFKAASPFSNFRNFIVAENTPGTLEAWFYSNEDEGGPRLRPLPEFSIGARREGDETLAEALHRRVSPKLKSPLINPADSVRLDGLTPIEQHWPDRPRLEAALRAAVMRVVPELKGETAKIRVSISPQGDFMVNSARLGPKTPTVPLLVMRLQEALYIWSSTILKAGRPISKGWVVGAVQNDDPLQLIRQATWRLGEITTVLDLEFSESAHEEFADEVILQQLEIQ